MTDELLSKGVDVPGSFWNLWGYMPTAQMRVPLLDLTIDSIPSGQRKQIEAVLKRMGRPISDPAILTFYQEYLAKTGHPPPAVP